MSGLLEGLAQLAEQLGHGTYQRGTPYTADQTAIVIGDVIPEPARLVCLRTYPAGPEPDSKLPFSEPYLQWRVRGTADEADSRDRCQALYDDLLGRGPVELPNGVLVLSIVAITPPVPLGRDEQGRHEHIVNTRVEFHDPTSQRPAL